MVKVGEDFVVYDAKTNEDITRQVLAQIIFEQEGVEGQALLPIAFLRQLIRCYGDGVQTLLPSYLEYSIDQFAGEKQAMREAASRAFGPGPSSPGSFGALKELTRKNLAAFNRALGLFSPFGAGGDKLAADAVEAAAPAAPPAAPPPPPVANADLEELRVQLAEMRRRLDSLTEKR
jgi:polyhydroxyalkanoate synthesis repressor PhaR